MSEKTVVQNSVEKTAQFRLPKYHEIPDVGLYLEQTSKYINDYLEQLGDFAITGSMISNYVKKKIVKNPIKKQYDRERIAYLIFIAIAKSVLSLDKINILLQRFPEKYSAETAYNYFCDELERTLHEISNVSETSEVDDGSSTGDAFAAFTTNNDVSMNAEPVLEKRMLNYIIITVAHKAVLDACFEEMQ